MITLKTNRWEINNIECVFFDKDGTLIDSHIYWGRIIEKRAGALISILNLNDSMYGELCRQMGFSLGNRKLLPEGPIALVSREKVIEKLCKYLYEKCITISKQRVAEIFTDVHSDFLKEIYEYTKILPRVMALLKTLKDKGIKTAVITTDSVKNAEEIMLHLGINKYFDLIIGKETVSEPKISGRPALMALESLNVSPERTVCIGDAPMDIIMSKNANCKAGIGVALGQISYEDLLKETEYVLHDYSELSVEGDDGH